MNASEQLELLEKVVELLEQANGANYEIVLHDLRRPYDSTIVDIRNGHKPGGPSGTAAVTGGWRSYGDGQRTEMNSTISPTPRTAKLYGLPPSIFGTTRGRSSPPFV